MEDFESRLWSHPLYNASQFIVVWTLVIMLVRNATGLVPNEVFLISGNGSSIPLNKPLHSNYCSAWLVGSMVLIICMFLVFGLWCERYRSKKRRTSLIAYNQQDGAPYCLYLPLSFHQLHNFWNPDDSETTYLMSSTKMNRKHYKKFIINMKPKKSQFKNNKTKRKFSYFVSIPEEEEHDYRKGVN